MGHPADHSAPGTIAGVLWQIDLGLIRLFELESREELQIETSDDLVEYRTDLGITVAIQAKHSLNGGTLTLRSVPLWKTLRVWIDIAAANDRALPAFELATTLSIAEDLAPLNAEASRPAERDIEAIVTMLNIIAEEQANESLMAAYTAWLTLPDARRTAIIGNVRLRGNLENLANIRRPLYAALRQQAIAEMLLDEARARLEMWYNDLIRERLGQGSCIVTKDEFLAELQDIHRSASAVVLPFAYAGADIPQMIVEQEGQRMYQRQLALIDASPDSKTHAYQMYTKARIEREALLRKTLVARQELTAHENDLVNMWRSNQVSVMESIAITESVMRGRQILQECVKAPSHLRSQPVPPHLHIGTLHIVADGPSPARIGWHPNYIALLEGTGDA